MCTFIVTIVTKILFRERNKASENGDLWVVVNLYDQHPFSPWIFLQTKVHSFAYLFSKYVSSTY